MLKNNFVLPKATGTFHYLEYESGQMYCFLPSEEAEKGEVRVYSYVPEFIIDFLYSVEIEQLRQVSDGKSQLKGQQEDKGKDKRTKKTRSNVTLSDFLKCEMINY